MHGLILAAGLGTRLGDLSEKHNKVLLDIGGVTLLENILNHFVRCGVNDTVVTVGYDAAAVRQKVGERALCVLNPFFDAYGILSSVWQVRPLLDGRPFLVTTGDHYFALPRLQTFLADQPSADVLADVEMKVCDDEDMKVFLNRRGELRTMTKTFLPGPVLGEFTATVRFSAEGSSQFFDVLEKHVWQHGIQGYLADVLCAYHRKWPLTFHLSNDHRRVEVDFPYDLARARDLYRQDRKTEAA